MKIGFYPGSFNPWHDGHDDVLQKALKVFDKIVILQLTNPDKPVPDDIMKYRKPDARTEVLRRENQLLTIVIGNYLLGMDLKDKNQYAIIRGLRNGQDLEYEKVQQYWNEDLGVLMPFVYFIADRKLTHVSSSAIRTIEKFVEKSNDPNGDYRSK